MRQILVDPSALEGLAVQLRRSGGELDSLFDGSLAVYRQMDVEVQVLGGVEEALAALERLRRVQGPALERLVRFLERQAEGFREADAGPEGVRPEVPAPVGAPVACSPLSLAPVGRDSRPKWLHNTSATLKLVGGVIGIVGGIALVTMATGGIGLLFIPAGVAGIVHATGGVIEGLHELSTGEDEANPVEQIYQGTFGEETGGKVYTAVDWGLTAIDVGLAAHGVAEGVGKVAEVGAKKVAKDAIKDSATLAVDVGNKTDATKQMYEKSRR